MVVKGISNIERIKLLEEENKRLKNDLMASGKYILENEVIIKKFKKGRPTVIEYQSYQYILDPNFLKQQRGS